MKSIDELNNYWQKEASAHDRYILVDRFGHDSVCPRSSAETSVAAPVCSHERTGENVAGLSTTIFRAGPRSCQWIADGGTVPNGPERAGAPCVGGNGGARGARRSCRRVRESPVRCPLLGHDHSGRQWSALLDIGKSSRDDAPSGVSGCLSGRLWRDGRQSQSADRTVESEAGAESQ